MRSTMLILFASIAVIACGAEAPPTAPLGAFVLDADAMTRALTAQGVPEKAARRRAAAGRVRLLFDPAGTFTLVVRDESGRAERAAGRWSRQGDALTLTTMDRGGQRIEPPEVVQANLDGDHLDVRPGRVGQLPFRLRRE